MNRASRYYLSPEPLLQSPNYVSAMARQGYSTPTYAYALNNPLRYTDPTGNNPAVIPIAIGVAAGEALVATGVIAAGVYCIGTQCLGTLHWPWDPVTPVAPMAPPKPEADAPPVCGPLTLSQTQEQCRKQHENNMKMCQDALRMRGLGDLTSTYVCNVCLSSERQMCMGQPPDPVAEAVCWALASKHGGFPFW